MLNKILILPVIAVLITILSFLPQYAAGATSYELQVGDSNRACEIIGGTWNSSTNTCTLNTNFTINAGDSLTIDSGVTLVNYGFITNNGGIINNSGTITNALGNI